MIKAQEQKQKLWSIPRITEAGKSMFTFEIAFCGQITMNIYNHIAEMSHVENDMSKMNLPETVPAVV